MEKKRHNKPNSYVWVMRRSSQRTKGFGVNILRGWRSPFLVYPEKLALCRWGIRDPLDIIAMFGLFVGYPKGKRDLGSIFRGFRDRLFWQFPRYWPILWGIRDPLDIIAMLGYELVTLIGEMSDGN